MYLALRILIAIPSKKPIQVLKDNFHQLFSLPSNLSSVKNNANCIAYCPLFLTTKSVSNLRKIKAEHFFFVPML